MNQPTITESLAAPANRPSETVPLPGDQMKATSPSAGSRASPTTQPF